MADKEGILITAIWLRALNDDVEVLVEIEGQWRLAIAYNRDGCLSHTAEARGAYRWPVDPHPDDAPPSHDVDPRATIAGKGRE